MGSACDAASEMEDFQFDKKYWEERSRVSSDDGLLVTDKLSCGEGI